MRMCLLFIAVAVFAADYKASPSEGEAVRKVIEDYRNASRNRDAKELQHVFAEDADIRGTNGAWLTSRTRIVEDQGAFFKRQKPSGDPAQRVSAPGPFAPRIRFLSSDIAIEDDSRVIDREGKQTVRMATIVLRKDGGQWRIVAVRFADTTTPATTDGPSTKK